MNLAFICIIIFFVANTQSISYFPGLYYYTEILRIILDGVLDKSGGNSQCAKDLRTFLADAYQKKKWAVQMLDASGKLQAGLLSGNFIHLGHYDQCLSISENIEGRDIKGQYCSVLLSSNPNFTTEFSQLLDLGQLTDYAGIQKTKQQEKILRYFKVAYGVCLPQSCSIDNLQNIWSYAETKFRASVQVSFLDFLCDYKDKPVEPYAVDPYIHAFLGIILLLVLLSTVYDIATNINGTNNDDLLICFSLYSNFKRLISTETAEGSITCINGIKALSLFWVILGHGFFTKIYNASVNSLYVLEWSRYWSSTFIYSAVLAVDTFLTISGILLLYTKMKLSKEFKIRILPFYFARFVRLTPALAAIVMFYTSVLKLLGDGPGWAILMKKAAGSCQRTWWLTLLYISNLIGAGYQCVEVAWYLSVDTQLYFVSPVILFNIEKHTRQTMLGLVVVCCISMAYTFFITIKYNYGYVLFDADLEYYSRVYSPTHVRMTPWLIGIFLGYFIVKYKSTHIEISRFLNITLWICSLGTMVCIILSHRSGLADSEYSAVYAACYNAFARPIWALCICWIIFACVTGNGGFVNQFLSTPIFKVLSKLSYSIYLTHFAALLLIHGRGRAPIHFSNSRGFHSFFGDAVFSIACSIILYLTFEAPTCSCIRILYNRRMKIKEIRDKKLNPTQSPAKSTRTVSTSNGNVVNKKTD